MSSIPTEHQEAVILANWLRKKEIEGHLHFLHIPNEAGAKKDNALRAQVIKKQEGMRRGSPDYLVFCKNNLVCVELKRQREILKDGSVSKKVSDVKEEQWHWHRVLNSKQYCEAYICFGADDAIEVISKYI